MGQKIDMVGLFVADLKRQAAFYRDVLGFALEWDGQGPYAEFTHAGVRFSMFERARLPGLLGQSPDYTEGLNGTFELAIDLPFAADVDAEFTRVTAAGARAVYTPRDEPWGMRSSMVADPEGNLIEIGSWNKGFSKSGEQSSNPSIHILEERALEERAMNAWPALFTQLYDGWVLRYANGYTRRSNSVHPLYASRDNLDEKLAVVERFYGERGLPAVYKLTRLSQPEGLDVVLERRGYRFEAHTSVQTLDLAGWQAGAGRAELLCSGFSEEWLGAYCTLSGTAEKNVPTLRRMLQGILPQHAFFLLPDGAGQAAACGLGVVENGWVGLFDIVVDASRRRQGWGERLVRGVLDWGVEQGARWSYLQVMLNNPPALGLYAKLGYREVYRYWYRVQGDKG